VVFKAAPVVLKVDPVVLKVDPRVAMVSVDRDLLLPLLQTNRFI